MDDRFYMKNIRNNGCMVGKGDQELTCEGLNGCEFKVVAKSVYSNMAIIEFVNAGGNPSIKLGHWDSIKWK